MFMRALPAIAISIACFLGATAAAHATESANSGETLAWLKKMAAASRQLNYSGTIVYQHGGHVETSRVVHYVNAAGGEFEKLETLDGPPREVIRSNEQVTCYLPTAKVVLIEQRNKNAQHFPALLPESVAGLTDSYTVRNEGVDRVAGHECQWITLAPRDNLRYGRSFCAELTSGLPLRARTLNEKGDTVESFAFTEVTLGGAFNRERVKSKYADKARTQGWRIDRSALSMAPVTPGETGWVLTSQLPGFKKLMEARRQMGSRGQVSQIVFSDGLAAVSVFVEPGSRASPQALTHQGAVNILTRNAGGNSVTVLGEAPVATIMQIANSLELRQKTTSAAVQ
jgi:sigma-E factor negative regulatory protein RseB